MRRANVVWGLSVLGIVGIAAACGSSTSSPQDGGIDSSASSSSSSSGGSGSGSSSGVGSSSGSSSSGGAGGVACGMTLTCSAPTPACCITGGGGGVGAPAGDAGGPTFSCAATAADCPTGSFVIGCTATSCSGSQVCCASGFTMEAGAGGFSCMDPSACTGRGTVQLCSLTGGPACPSGETCQVFNGAGFCGVAFDGNFPAFDGNFPGFDGNFPAFDGGAAADAQVARDASGEGGD